eukprot:722894_1
MADNEYKAEYAKTGRAKCKEKKCGQVIQSGALRVAKMVKNPFTDDDSKCAHWYHPQCIFDSLARAKKTTKKIESENDLEGFTDLLDVDQTMLRGLISTDHSTKSKPPSSAPRKSPGPSRKQTDSSNGRSIVSFFSPTSKKRALPSNSSSVGSRKIKKIVHSPSSVPFSVTENESVRLETEKKFYLISRSGREVIVLAGYKSARFTAPKEHKFVKGSVESARRVMVSMIKQAKKKGYAEVGSKSANVASVSTGDDALDRKNVHNSDVAAPAGTVAWEWKTDKGWAAYDDPTIRQIENAFQENPKGSVTLSKGYFASNSGYILSFDQMTQRHTVRVAVRAVRRRSVEASAPTQSAMPSSSSMEVENHHVKPKKREKAESSGSNTEEYDGDQEENLIKPSCGDHQDPVTATLMRMFDSSAISVRLTELNYRSKALPFDELSAKRFQDAFDILSMMKMCILVDQRGELIELCKKFFELIPYEFGYNRPLLISSTDRLQVAYARLTELFYMFATLTHIRAKGPLGLSASLPFQLKVLEKSSGDWQNIAQCVNSTQMKSESTHSVVLADVLEIISTNHKSAYDGERNNRRLLWVAMRPLEYGAVLADGFLCSKNWGTQLFDLLTPCIQKIQSFGQSDSPYLLAVLCELSLPAQLPTEIIDWEPFSETRSENVGIISGCNKSNDKYLAKMDDGALLPGGRPLRSVDLRVQQPFRTFMAHNPSWLRPRYVVRLQKSKSD